MEFFYATDAMIWYHENRYYAAGLANIIKRYHKYFGKFNILCRVKNCEPKTPLTDVTDCLNNVIGVKSLFKFINISNSLSKEIRNKINESSIVAIRVPALCGKFVNNYARKINKPVLVEMMGCPWDSNWNHSLKGKFLAPKMWYETKKICEQATYAHYVTEGFLQKRYPSKCIQLAASDVIIKPIDQETIQKRETFISQLNPVSISLMTSAACNVKYKGQQYVIAALKILKEQGITANYYICGDGSIDYLQKVAKKNGVEDIVHFKGRLTLPEVIDLLDKTDIYIQPSLQEGLPRALVEALSRGCPAIGAKTGGIPELLPSDCIVKRKSPEAIAKAIQKMIKNGLHQYSVASFNRAKDFEFDNLDQKFNNFYRIILNDITQN